LNSAKANFTLEELGWMLYPLGKIEDWDGQFNWFIDLVNAHSEYLHVPYIKEWFIASKKI
jgi:hypothetical protein